MKPSEILNYFRHPTTETGFSPVYQAGRREWNECYGVYVQSAKRAWLVAYGCIAVTVLAVGMMGYDDSLSKFVPYIVERDHLGDEVAVGLLNPTSPADPVIIQSVINQWLHDVRTVSSDGQTAKDNAWSAYWHTNAHAPAKIQLDDWFTSPQTPTERAKTELVNITVISTLPRVAGEWKNWEAKWREETRTRSGELVSNLIKEASITVSRNTPTTATEIKHNVSGVFVDNFDWKN